MMGDLGTIFTALSLLATLYATVAAVISEHHKDQRWWLSARNALIGAAVLLGVAVLILTRAFVADAFEIRYVAQHSSQSLPLYLKLSAVWAGQEGSLLLWSFFQALFTAIAIVLPAERAKPLVRWAGAVLGLIGTFFIGVTLFASNPFAQLTQIPMDGQGLNPLLRHPGMIFHPPAMYVGYVGLSVPFAFATAALILGTTHRWTSATRVWTLIAWLGLSLGLLLGMRWAYDVLGWGGYWGWDPVENAGLMPWFTATALLHGAVMQDERRGFRIWNHLLVTASFVLVLFGTFATRSGVIQSVHAYARSSIGGYFLVAILATLVSSLSLIVWRRRALSAGSDSGDEPLLSRDGLFFLTLLIFSMLTVSVMVGSTLPTITNLVAGRKFEAGSDWFDRVTGPQFGVLVLLMGICPLAGRAGAAMQRLRRWRWVVAAGTVLVVAGAALAGFTKAVSLVGFAFTGLAATTVALEMGEGVAKRTKATGAAPLNALWAILRQQRRKYGGYLVHLGVILMAVGVIGTRMYPFEREIVPAVGETIQVAGYDLTLNMLSRDSADDHVSTWAEVVVTRDGAYLTTLRPRVNQYEHYDQLYTVPAVHPALREDLYVILAGWGAAGATATLKVMVNALANFLWLGGLVFFAGGALALWPKAKVQAWNVVAAIALATLLAGGTWAMWGAPHGTDVGSMSERPVIGRPVPDFRLPLIEGDVVSMADLAGQVVVLNFWAPWCDPCTEELPILRRAHAVYADQGVAFVGVAYQSELDAVAEAAATYGLDFALGIDTGDRISDAYAITGVPETFIVDADGRLAFVHIGPLVEAQLQSELDALLGRP